VTAPPILISRGEQVARLTFPLSITQQKLLGSFFILHGLAHAAVGIWAAETGRWWLIASLWELAMVGFIAAGLGAWGVAGLRDLWKALTTVAASASILLFLSSPHAAFLFGIGIDISALALVAYALPARADAAQQPHRSHPIRRLLGIFLSWSLILYVALIVGVRQWNVQWGTVPAERAMALPGDDLVPVAHYHIDHGITIAAPSSSVWPWLVQMGQDRAGFYSYSVLENAVGARVTNADQVLAYWQSRQTGDLVRAVPPDWLGGHFGTEIGWRVRELIPERAMVLEGWGAFVLVSLDDSTTRLLVRTRGAGVPNQRMVALSPFGLLVFEPAHLVMERRMLIGIKERAERTVDKTFLVRED